MKDGEIAKVIWNRLCSNFEPKGRRLSVGISSNLSASSEFLLSSAFLIVLISFCFLHRSGEAISVKTSSHCN
ncbi:hypothetical protein QTP88_002250 [Uroleucon formosanum]